MSQVSQIGMLLYLMLAIFGGFLTGLFSCYSYDTLKLELNKPFVVLICSIFYVAPVWAAYSLFKQDDLDIFYLLLIMSFIYGRYHYSRISAGDAHARKGESYYPDEEDN